MEWMFELHPALKKSIKLKGKMSAKGWVIWEAYEDPSHLRLTVDKQKSLELPELDKGTINTSDSAKVSSDLISTSNEHFSLS